MSQTHKVVVLPAKGQDLVVKQAPIPQVVPGAVIIKVLSVVVSPNTKKFHGADGPVPLTTPIIPGSSAIGRVHAVGADATSLKVGQLVIADILIRSRDDPDDSILHAYIGSEGGGKILMEGEWRDGAYAQYAKYPLESVFPLNEDLLVKQMGYSFHDLVRLSALFIIAAGCYEINIKAGDSVIVAPATGFFGGAAVHYALAMGATVIAAARGESKLKHLEETFKSTGRLTTVKLTGDASVDTAALKAVSGSAKGADAYLDWSPPAAAKSTHIQACINALRPFGKVALVGGIFGNIEIPYFFVMANSIAIVGRYMYDRNHVLQVIKLAEKGIIKLGPGENSGTKIKGSFSLDEVPKAIAAAADTGVGEMVVLEP